MPILKKIREDIVNTVERGSTQQGLMQGSLRAELLNLFDLHIHIQHDYDKSIKCIESDYAKLKLMYMA